LELYLRAPVCLVVYLLPTTTTTTIIIIITIKIIAIIIIQLISTQLAVVTLRLNNTSANCKASTKHT